MMRHHKLILALCLALTSVPALGFLHRTIWPVPWAHITSARPDPRQTGQYQIYDSSLGEWVWIGPAFHCEHRDAHEFMKVKMFRHLVIEDGAYAVLVEDPRSKVWKRQVWVAFTRDMFQTVHEAQAN